jgi:hypothetical protein
MLQPMESAPLDRTVIVRATQMIPGLGSIGPLFDTAARFYPEHGYWAAEDKPQSGLPSLGLVPLDVHGWIC